MATARRDEDLLDFVFTRQWREAIAAIHDGADVNEQDSYGWRSPLHVVATRKTPLDLVQLLIDKGANPNVISSDGETPLHLAAEGNSPVELVKLLIESGANMETRDRNGLTALHRAATGNASPALVQLLIDKGADTNAKTHVSLTTKNGETALFISKARKREALIPLLSKYRPKTPPPIVGSSSNAPPSSANRDAPSDDKRMARTNPLASAPSAVASSPSPSTPFSQGIQPSGRSEMVANPSLSSPAPAGKEYLLFFSYAQKDTLAETTIFFNEAQARFPKQKIFRDNEKKFKLNELIQHVRSAKNVVILLSGNYAKRPFTLVELHHALKSGANICPVKVSRPGMEPFDFEQIKTDIKSGKIKDYLNEDGWDLLLQQDITMENVMKDLQEVMNVTASSFSVEHPSEVQKVMMKVIFDGMTM